MSLREGRLPRFETVTRWHLSPVAQKAHSCEYYPTLKVRPNLKQLFLKTCLSTFIVALGVVSSVVAQTTVKPATAAIQNSHSTALTQSAAVSLSSLPEADTLIYISPQRILNGAAPRVMTPADVEKMRATFFDLKRSLGVDPATIDYVVIAVRFHKPAADLSFVPPDVLAVVGGDFSAESLVTLAKLSLQDKVRDEKHGSKTIALMTVDQIAEAAVKTPMLKSFVEIGAVALSPNSIAIGNLPYLKAAVDAADGNGRISATALNSLLRDPNALISAAGSPLSAFAKSFGLLGTDTTPRDPRCDTRFGDFYSAVTMDSGNFSLRGAMHADNPDTAKIINGLLSAVMQQALASVPDKSAQTLLKGIRMTAKESEVVLEGDIPEQTVADFVREQMKPTPPAAAEKPAVKRPIKRRRAGRK